MTPFDADYDIHDYRPDDAAALFVVAAAIATLEAGQMLHWTQALERRVDDGARVWVAARGRRLAGYALVEGVPGLPGVADLSGGVVPARRRQGVGGRLLERVAADAATLGLAQLSCRVERMDDEEARFLLKRGFALEHEECLLELDDLGALPPVPATPAADLLTLPRERAVAAFCHVYDRAFAGHPWSQPYTAGEVAAALGRAEDLLFAVRDGEPIGVVWHERLPDGRGRVEPLGIAAGHQGQGHGRRLLLAALHELRRQGARPLEIGVWRDNHAARHLYESLGFRQAANWYYLARDVAPLQAAREAGLKGQ